MASWEPVDIVIYAGAAFVAVLMLVRLMARRRDQLLDDLSRDAQSLRPAKSAEPLKN